MNKKILISLLVLVFLVRGCSVSFKKKPIEDGSPSSMFTQTLTSCDLADECKETLKTCFEKQAKSEGEDVFSDDWNYEMGWDPNNDK